ncbi:hypothetical protein PSHT_02381 [Puccinia striiformis]|uniref:CCHC-type domain-containing protein n=2 Tax=Puccinia striiformis TaxID=27350 RepID=A0A2S4WI77_9BASI|nr:hypothetical protein PSHT_02381 [Puccinia striiformis]
MAETSPPNKDNRNSTFNQSTPSALPPQSAFAELERSLPPLPDSERTHTLQEPIDLNMGVSPRDVNPFATSLALASSASTPVPAYIDRLEWNRPQSTAQALVPIRPQSTAPPLIPIPTVSNQPVTPATNPAPLENHTENRARDAEEEAYIPPSELAKTMLDNQWYLFKRARESQNVALMRTALEQAISTQALLTNLIGRDEMLRRTNGYVDPSPTLDESTEPRAYYSPKQSSTDAQNPSTDPRDHVPGSYSFCDSRAITTTPSAANSTAFYTPGVPESTHCFKTSHASAAIRQPSTSTPLRTPTVPAPAPPSLRPTSPTQWSRPRARMETRRPHDEDGQDGPVLRKSGEGYWANGQNSWSRQGRKKPPLSTISESDSPPISSPLENHNNPSLHSSSEPSSREKFLNSLHSQFVPDTTFLLEDKIRDMFSLFLSELTHTLETVPPSLVQTCVSKFESSIHKTLQEMMTNEIMPSLISQVLHHVTNNPLHKETTMNFKEELIPLQTFIKENIECVQDIMHVNDSQMQSNADQLKQDISELKHAQEAQFHYIAQQLADLSNKENDKFDHIKRRLGDMNQIISTLPGKINPPPPHEEKAPPPHLHYNNPFLNHVYNVPPMPQEPIIQHQPEIAVSSVSLTKSEPEWMALFPFIKHDIDKEVRREIWKAIPKTNEWETFNGELPYNHELWLQNIDVFVKDYYLLDHMIVSRLTTILTSTAKNWYLGLRNKHGDKSWAWWKNAIRNKFGTDNWKWRVQEEFEADRFYLENKKIHKWFNTQRDRLRAFQPELSEFLVCAKILKQCPGTLDNAIKSRYKGDPSDMCFDEMVIIAEDIIAKTMRSTIPTHQSSYQSNRQASQSQYPPRKSDPQKSDPDTKKTAPSPNGTKGPKCFFCQQTGHLSKDCPKKRNRINNVEGQSGDNNTGEEETQDDYDFDQPLNSEDDGDDKDSALVLAMQQHDLDHPLLSLGNHAIECELSQDLSIAEIQAACHQPQTWSTDCQTSHIEDARLMKCKPDKGKAHLLGSQNLTNVLIDGNQYTCLLDSGASCSIISQQLLHSIKPLWQDNLMPIHQARFHSCSDQLIPLGVVELPLIFPHTKGSVRVQTEFVVMKNARMNYIIIGNDYLSLYGFDINNSKDRYFTIGNENKKKKFSFKSHQAEVMTPSSEISAVTKQKTLMSHEVHIKLTTERPYPPLLRRPPYPASPKSREALEEHIEELVRLNVLRKVGHNEVVEITTPVIIAWHNGKSRMVGDFRALNTYTAADRYPIPKITETLNNLAKAKFLTSMDVLKGFHQNVIAEDSKKFLRIILHKGIYEYLRMPFGIKNAPSHFQRMMDIEFRQEINEKWVIIYIDDIIIMSNSWEEHLTRIDRILKIVINMNMKIS